MCSLSAYLDGDPVTDETAVEVLGRAGIEVSDRLCRHHAAQYELLVEQYLEGLSRRKGSDAREPASGSSRPAEGPGSQRNVAEGQPRALDPLLREE